MSHTDRTSVAIACQGGGSHTAFTAGALQRILSESDPNYRIDALSGTSGGALCAFAAWYGLRTGDRHKAIDLLDALWESVAATSPAEQFANFGLVGATRLREMGLPVGQVHLPWVSRLGSQRLRTILESLVDDQPIADLRLERPPADPEEPLPTKLLVSAVDVNDGSFSVFTDRPRLEPTPDGGVLTEVVPPSIERRIEERPKPISIDAILASAAVPPLFEPVEIPEPDGATHAYWDGLFSQNPPIRNFLSGPKTVARKPDEIWIVRINPTTRDGRFTSTEAIANRRNELSGNLSLHQELFFISQVNDWLDEGRLTEAAREQLKPITVRQIELDERRLNPPQRLVTATKLDRDPGLLADLTRLGQQQADEFLMNPDEYAIIE